MKNKNMIVPPHFIHGNNLRMNFLVAVILLFAASAVLAQTKNKTNTSSDTTELIDQYIKARGYSNIISFDALNIKQFWVDNTVMSNNGFIHILLDTQTRNSRPQKVQLANVNEAMDCRIDVITENPDVSFFVTNSKSKTISKSFAEDDFIQYHVISSVFHLEDTQDYSFNLIFGSNKPDTLTIKKIFLSFSKNPDSIFCVSPGVFVVSAKDVTAQAVPDSEGKGFTVTGKESNIFLKKKIMVSENTVKTSVTIKNTGKKTTRVHIGYSAYSKDDILLWGCNYPYKNINKVLNVVSSEDGSAKITVDSFPEWTKNCFLALNAREDLSDIPNTSLAAGKIIDIKKLPDGRAEITMDQPVKKALKQGEKVRINGLRGAYLYTSSKELQPGEEETFTSSIQKDDNMIQYSVNALSRGVYYVKPLILSNSVDTKEENTILITNYQIGY